MNINGLCSLILALVLLGLAPGAQADDYTLTITSNPTNPTGTSATLSASGTFGIHVTYSWSMISGPGNMTFTPASIKSELGTSMSTTATFTKAGTYVVKIYGAGYAGDIFPVWTTGTGQANVVVVQTPAGVSLGGPTTVVGGNAPTYAGSVLDQFGSSMPGTVAYSASGGTMNPTTGQWTAPFQPGNYTISATGGGFTKSQPVTVTANPVNLSAPTAVKRPSVYPYKIDLSTMGSGGSGESTFRYDWTATAYPAGSAPVISPTGTNAAKTTVATATLPGTYTFKVVATDGVGTTANASVSITITAPAINLTSVTATSQTDIRNVALAAVASGGTAAANLTYTWSATSLPAGAQAPGISPNSTTAAANSVAVVKAGGPYTFTVVVLDTQSGVSVQGSATVNVPLSTMTLATPIATPSADYRSIALSVVASNPVGQPTYTWSMTGPATAPVTPNASTAAASATAALTKAGTYSSISVTALDEFGKSVTVTVPGSVVIPAVPQRIDVLPAVAAIMPGGSRSFTAFVPDQFNAAISNPPITWSVTAGGAITNTGNFTASATATGTGTVLATYVGNAVPAGSATVTYATSGPISASWQGGTGRSSYPLGMPTTSVVQLTIRFITFTEPDALDVRVNGQVVASTNGPISTDGAPWNGSAWTKVITVQGGDVVFDVSGGAPGTGWTLNVSGNWAGYTGIVVAPSTKDVQVGTTATFQATATLPDGSAAVIQPGIAWTLTGAGSISPSQGASTTFTAPATEGTAQLQASATGLTGTGSARVINNAPPSVTASATPNQIGVPPGVVQLSATVQDDGKTSTPLTYAWTKVSGPADVTFQNAAAKTTLASLIPSVGQPPWTAPQQEVLRLTVSDGLASTSSDVTITMTRNAPPVARGPRLYQFNPVFPTPITLDTMDPDGDTMSLSIDAAPLYGTITPSAFANSVTYTVTSPLKAPKDRFVWHVSDVWGAPSYPMSTTLLDMTRFNDLATDPSSLAWSELQDDLLPKVQAEIMEAKYRDAIRASRDPIRYGSGEMEMAEDDVDAQAPAALHLRRSYSNLRGSIAAEIGDGWMLDAAPRLFINGSSAVVQMSAQGGVGFSNAAGVWTAVRDPHATLKDIPGNLLAFGDDQGARIVFYGFAAAVPSGLRGCAKVAYGAGGSRIQYVYDAQYCLRQVQRQANAALAETLNLTWSADLTRIVAVERCREEVGKATVVIRRVEYAYYGGAPAEFGELGQLQTVTVRDGTVAGPNNILRRFHYRYWRQSTGGGYAGNLRFAVGPRTWERMAAQQLDPTQVTDAVLATWADKSFEYDTQARVNKQTLRTPDVDGSGIYQYSYASNPSVTTPSTAGINVWTSKTTESQPDGSQNIVWCNRVGDVMLKATVDIGGARTWLNAYRYTDQGRLSWHLTPAAVTGYDETKPDLLDFASGNSPFVPDGAGLIERWTYYATTDAPNGAIAGYVADEMRQIGEMGQPTLDRHTTYTLHTAP